jgi:hypothetical protein
MSKRTKAKQIVLGLPLDGTFGTTNVPGVDSSDNPTEAFDKVIRILDLLAPPTSPGLSARSLSIAGSYSGRECSASASPGVDYPIIIDDVQPTAAVNAEFSDGDTGTLEAKVNTVVEGTVNLTTADDTGIYGSLEILTDEDPYPGPPEAGFWKSLTAEMTSAAPLPTDNTVQNYEMEHSDTGATVLDFKVDTVPVTPSITLSADPLNVKTGYTTKYVSGVPGLSAGDLLEYEFTINNAVSRFYHSSRIATITGSQIANLNVADPLAIPAPGGTMNVFEESAILNNVHTTDLAVVFRGYNVKNVASPSTTVTRDDSAINEKIYVDTISDETIRVRSGQGTYPSYGPAGAASFGETYNNSISQEVIGTGNVVEELQLIAGIFRYPAGDYTNNYPVAGPNYTSITGQKWATFRIGSVTNASSVTFRFQTPSGINEEALGSTVTLNMDVQVQVEGSTGWLDANTKYTSGNPNANGDACYDVAGSPNDGITRRCTFGTQTLTGDVYVRVGLPTGSSKSFADVVIV